MATELIALQMGMVLEPGGISNQLVTATGSGEMKFSDFRMSNGEGQMGVFKTVQAHNRGVLSALAAHPAAPLIATGTTSQVHCLSLKTVTFPVLQ